MNSLGASQYKDELVIDGSSVIWSVNDGLVHKRTFNFENDGQPIAQALFTVFSPSTPPSTPSPKDPHDVDNSPSRSTDTATKALVVVLKTLMHIIYIDSGGSYIVHLPFPVAKIWSIPIGLLLERELDSPPSSSSPDSSFASFESESKLPRLFTLSNPLEDFGMVTCNHSSQRDSNEEILFVSSHKNTLCVTRNLPEHRITLWYASPDPQARRKVYPSKTSLTSPISKEEDPLWVTLHSNTTTMTTWNQQNYVSQRVAKPWNAITLGFRTSASPWTERHSQTLTD
jgi:hypothetical protein